ncbi:hypothetical protein CPB83DRAFT_848392 [Crepidotus variabilis]|uniref:C2H2-type domain-containing protein n=1 Tax=Crepidotus variabilis TaxID=179855 RepID=A0A9P6EN07_9AGAR|nr:hypothetical protein CPB83DRAFT_848392 [Crepidotus variabilis]
MPYCERCDRSFRNISAMEQHQRDSSEHYICHDCDRDFTSWNALQQHWLQSPLHEYCQDCDEHFDDHDDLEEHLESEHWYCGDCERVCKSEMALKAHYRQSDNHYYCEPCDRHFLNENALRNHLNSSTHQPKNVKCPFRGCGKAFVSRAALVLHLEGGACPSGVDRKTINKLVHKYDKNHIITDPSRLIGGASSNDSDEDVEDIATERSWNGFGYECYFCQKEFPTLKRLNQHLASPVHKAQIYRCPGRHCEAHFSTLSALVQHIESQKCDVYENRAVKKDMETIFKQMGRLTM